MGHSLNQKVVAEFVATTFLVWVGCGTYVSSQATTINGSSAEIFFLPAVALAFGVGYAVLSMSIAPISGGHMNPAITFAFVVLGDMNLIDASAYFSAQCLGGIFGASLVYGCSASPTLMDMNDVGDKDPPNLLGSNVIATPELPLASAFLGEAVGTFLLVWAVLMTAVYQKSIAGHLAPIMIGFAYLLAHLVLLPLTSSGINPARTLGPHLVVILSGNKVGFEGWWIFYTAPFLGSAIAAYVLSIMFELQEEYEDSDDDDDDDDSVKHPDE